MTDEDQDQQDQPEPDDGPDPGQDQDTIELPNHQPDEGVAGVYAKVAQVAAAIEDIPKTGHNDYFNYDYHEADVVMAHLRPKLAQAGLVVIPRQGDIEEEVVQTQQGEAVLTTILHQIEFVDVEDGSSFTVPVYGRGQDSGDKGPMKAFTMAAKYATMKVFGVAAGGDMDPDSQGPPERTGGERQPRRSQDGGGGDDRAPLPDAPVDCPECGSTMMDFRPRKEAGDYKSNAPDFKCSADQCEHSVWNASVFMVKRKHRQLLEKFDIEAGDIAAYVEAADEPQYEDWEPQNMADFNARVETHGRDLFRKAREQLQPSDQCPECGDPLQGKDQCGNCGWDPDAAPPDEGEEDDGGEGEPSEEEDGEFTPKLWPDNRDPAVYLSAQDADNPRLNAVAEWVVEERERREEGEQPREFPGMFASEFKPEGDEDEDQDSLFD